MFLVVRTPRKSVQPVYDKFGGHKRTTGEAGIVTMCILGIGFGLYRVKLRTLDKPIGFLVLKPSGVRFAQVSFRNYLVNWGYMAGIGIRIRFIWVMHRLRLWIVGHSRGLEYSGFRWQSSSIKLNQASRYLRHWTFSAGLLLSFSLNQQSSVLTPAPAALTSTCPNFLVNHRSRSPHSPAISSAYDLITPDRPYHPLSSLSPHPQ